MAGTLEHFVAFGTDIVGIERIFRLGQALLLVLTSYPSLLSHLIIALSSSPSPAAGFASTAVALVQLQTQINLTRRAIRLFWFLGSLQTSWTLFADVSQAGLEGWLGVLAHSSLGLFGLMESATLLDLANAAAGRGSVGVGAGIELFGATEAVRLDREAQVLWLVGLCASALAAAAKVLRMMAYRPVPQTGDGFGGAALGDGAAAVREKQIKEKKKGKQDDGQEGFDDDGGEKTVARARDRDEKRKESEKQSAGEVSAVVMKLVADVLDMVIPAAKLGWLEVDDGQVGVAMVLSTILTGKLVWNRCRPRL